MEPEDFYSVAAHLLAAPPEGKEEAAKRTAVSRIYYAAFLYAREVMRGWGCEFVDRVVHAQVAEGLKYSKEGGIARIGKRLSGLHRERKRADYDTGEEHKFDVGKLRGMYADVVPGLEERLTLLNDTLRQAVIRNVKDKIEAIRRAAESDRR